MTIFTPEGKPPDWFRFSGRVLPLAHITEQTFDLVFITEPDFLTHLLKVSSKLKVFYHVGPRANLSEVLKHKEIKIFANSTNMFLHDKKEYGIEPYKAYGGVHIPATSKEIADNHPFVIMCYGRLGRKGKGTRIVAKAAEKLYKTGRDVKLVMFDTPIDEKSTRLINNFKPNVPFEFILNHPVEDNANLFKKADVFVAVEKRGGWSNTAAEALAAGVPLVGSNTGTNDFLIDGETGLKVWRHSFFVSRAIARLMDDLEYRKKLATAGRKKMEEYSWQALANNILNYLETQLPHADRF